MQGNENAMGSEIKTVGYAAVICLICSLILSSVYSTLKPRQDLNKALDVKIKVLQTFGVPVVDAKGRTIMKPQQVETLFSQQVEGFVLDGSGKRDEGRSVNSLTSDDINKRDKSTGLKAFYPYYVFTDPSTGKKSYAIHVSGMGLWSVIKGYIALQEDLATVAGIAIYDHAETPGLGGEVVQPWFQNQFAGKKLAENGKAKYFRVLRPSEMVDDSSVHGPSGSTMTGNGMTDFINKDFKVYHDHFLTQRGG